MDKAKNLREASSQDIEMAAGMRTSIQRLVKVLRKQTHNDEMLSLTERSTMGLLYAQGGLPPNELAQIERVSAQSMSQVIGNLSELSYISKTPSLEDKRKVLISLTAAGKAYIERLRQEKQEWLALAIHEKLVPEEKEILAKALAIITKLIDE